jgi:fermentation-respiration switch protein FrsA (DUF1100 family)
MKRLGRIIARVVVVAVIAYAAVLGAMYVFQRELQYDRSGRMFALSETKLRGTEQVSIPVGGGESITGWYAPPATGKPVILYFRGNSQSFSREHQRYEAFAAVGYGFLAFDYRGFPGSPGELTEAHVLEDGLAAYDWLKPKGFPIVIWGRSLGSGPATYVASLREADALFLETPFKSAVSVAAERYPFLPVGLVMSDQYPVDTWIAGVTEPVYVVHGTADATIPVHHAEQLYALAPNPQGIRIIEGGAHGDLWDYGIWDDAQRFFAGAEAQAVR